MPFQQRFRHTPFGLLILLLLTAQAWASQTESVATEPTAPSHPRIGLALGSGGAAGLAHIAILKAFDEAGQRPTRIAGSSIGAIIGALYAAGMSGSEIEALFAEFGGSGFELLGNLASGENGISLTGLIDLDLDDGGVIDPEPFFDHLRSRIEARSFSDLDIPLVVVATNYFSGESVTLEQGDLFQALSASMAVPGLFLPVERDGALLVDGGVSNPLPWDLLGEEVDYVIAVDVSGQRERPVDGTLPASEMLFKAFELMQPSIVREKLRTNEPDLYLRPEVEGIRLLHFHRVETIIEQTGATAERLRQYLDDASKQPVHNKD